ncbi:MAG: Lnb N-terminal periplasmic domain-containing protein [Gammaproteobacteria bacterium]
MSTAFVPSFLGCFLFSVVAHARPAVDLKTLAGMPGWIKLGHYERDRASPTGWRSAIHSNEFFLASNGRFNPQAELKATLAAFAEPPAADPDKQPRCRFPARWLWLKSRMVGAPTFQNQKPVCPALDAWTRSGNVASVSIVFVTGYLGNPASYYGHTLLKFNYRDDTGQTRLMDVSVNFGAILEKHDDPVTYLVKSVTGGYEAGFSHIQFYFHDHNYGENELRDMWEYRLNLPQEAVDLIVAHAWEVLGKRYDYGFFRENCAYRMAELLEVADGLTIIPDKTPWIVPQSVIEEIGRAKYHGNLVLAEVKYLPSRQSRFYEKYSGLTPQDTALLKDLATGRVHFDERRFQTLTPHSQQTVLDALLDYYQYIGSPWDKAPRDIQKKYADVLAVRYQLVPGSPEIKRLQPISPHLARPPEWAQAAWRHNTVTGDGLAIRIRPAYYDALDTDSGNVRNSKLVMGDLQFSIKRSRAFIEKLDLIGVDSANPGLTGMAGDERTAWKVHVGAEQARLTCDGCLVARLQGDYGYGRQWSDHLFGAVYIGGALQSRWADQGFGFGRTSADLIARFNDRLGVKLAYEQRFPVGGNRASYGVAAAEVRWSIATRADLRINYERDRAQQFSVGLGVYW